MALHVRMEVDLAYFLKFSSLGSGILSVFLAGYGIVFCLPLGHNVEHFASLSAYIPA